MTHDERVKLTAEIAELIYNIYFPNPCGQELSRHAAKRVVTKLEDEEILK